MQGLGVGIPWQLAANDAGYYNRALGRLMPDWWVTWKWDAHDYIYPPYAPMVWAMKLDRYANEAVALTHYGPRLWLCGNEPERADQSDTPPEVAADFSRWWEHAASGTWAGPGVLLGLSAAYAWLDAYLGAGGVVPAAWAVHDYAWTEVQWDDLLDEFLRWMARNKVERPVIVSETACWGPYLSDQIKVMDAAVEALEDGRIQAAAWYAGRDPFGLLSASDLLTVAGALTALGAHYVAVREGGVTEPAELETQVYLPLIAREGEPA